jgi:diacylglycerol kinase family enzyme
VVVAARPPLVALMQVPWIFTGRIARLRGVTMRSAVDIEITSAQPVVYHVDGEPFVGAAAISARSRPGALRVIVPHDEQLDVLDPSVRKEQDA